MLYRSITNFFIPSLDPFFGKEEEEEEDFFEHSGRTRYTEHWHQSLVRAGFRFLREENSLLVCSMPIMDPSMLASTILLKQVLEGNRTRTCYGMEVALD